jgi:hypothetical protein
MCKKRNNLVGRVHRDNPQLKLSCSFVRIPSTQHTRWLISRTLYYLPFSPPQIACSQPYRPYHTPIRRPNLPNLGYTQHRHLDAVCEMSMLVPVCSWLNRMQVHIKSNASTEEGHMGISSRMCATELAVERRRYKPRCSPHIERGDPSITIWRSSYIARALWSSKIIIVSCFISTSGEIKRICVYILRALSPRSEGSQWWRHFTCGCCVDKYVAFLPYLHTWTLCHA